MATPQEIDRLPDSVMTDAESSTESVADLSSCRFCLFKESLQNQLSHIRPSFVDTDNTVEEFAQLFTEVDQHHHPEDKAQAQELMNNERSFSEMAGTCGNLIQYFVGDLVGGGEEGPEESAEMVTGHINTIVKLARIQGCLDTLSLFETGFSIAEDSEDV